MYFDNTAVAPADERLHALEASRRRLLDAMLVLRCDCADVFADPRRTGAERDGAALELADAVGRIQKCDDELHALREEARRGAAAQPPGSTPQGWFA